MKRAAVLSLAAALAVARAQLEPQYLAPNPPDTVSCFAADSLVWRSIPGKMVVTGDAPKPKPKAAAPVAAPAAHPGLDEEDEVAAPAAPKAPKAAAVAVGVHDAVDKQAVVDAGADAGAAAEEEDKAKAAPKPVPAQVQVKALNWFGLDRINIFEGTNYKTIDEVWGRMGVRWGMGGVVC